MKTTGQLLWIGSLVLFLLVAIFFPVTVETRIPRSGLYGLSGGYSQDVVNIHRVSVQLLIAIGLAATFAGGLALHGIAIMRDEAWAWRRRGTIWDPAVPAAGLDDSQIAELGIVWNGQSWQSPDGYFGELDDAVHFARLHRRPN